MVCGGNGNGRGVDLCGGGVFSLVISVNGGGGSESNILLS